MVPAAAPIPGAAVEAGPRLGDGRDPSPGARPPQGASGLRTIRLGGSAGPAASIRGKRSIAPMAPPASSASALIRMMARVSSLRSRSRRPRLASRWRLLSSASTLPRVMFGCPSRRSASSRRARSASARGAHLAHGEPPLRVLADVDRIPLELRHLVSPGERPAYCHGRAPGRRAGRGGGSGGSGGVAVQAVRRHPGRQPLVVDRAERGRAPRARCARPRLRSRASTATIGGRPFAGFGTPRGSWSTPR